MDNIVLVAIVPRKKDWQILENQHWYRIPVNSAPEITPRVKYLAFYQPAIFGQEKYKVNYFAKVKEIKVVKRIELLPDEPEHPKRENDYYKINIGELQKLTSPIRSERWRRIAFIPTILSKLKKAKEINDLYHTSFIEEKLYNKIKEEKIPTERQLFVREKDATYCLDFAILCKDGKIDVECDGKQHYSTYDRLMYDRERNNELTSSGWSVLRFTTNQINQDMSKCVKQIKKTIKSLKGVSNREVRKPQLTFLLLSLSLHQSNLISLSPQP